MKRGVLDPKKKKETTASESKSESEGRIKKRGHEQKRERASEQVSEQVQERERGRALGRGLKSTQELESKQEDWEQAQVPAMQLAELFAGHTSYLRRPGIPFECRYEVFNQCVTLQRTTQLVV
mmetsp:Transcript_28795/g.46601  ORF Transcript_28795/g.46601 Transcript_28795/m.46601 type:complete len:123 (+) Transcript_28795:1010-1378(+)